MNQNFDVIIIGSGAGGAVLAKEISEGGMRVALLEEGSYHKTTDHTDQAHRAVERLYRDRGFTTTLGQPVIPIPLGRAVGGTTVVNSGTCFRTPERVLRHWQQDLGLTTLDDATFARLFDIVEREINVEEARFEVMGESNRMVHELLLRKGLRGKPLRRNIKNCEGCGFCCYGCSSGAKQSMDVSYVPKALKAGATLFAQCRVDRLLREGRRVIGVTAKLLNKEGLPTGKRLTLHAPRTVVAAGSLISPDLLRRNRIARGNRNLGRNLTIHPATKVFAAFDREINGWEGTPQAYYFDGFQDQGYIFEGIFVPPDIAAMTVPFVGRKLINFMNDYRRMATFGFMISDSGSGRVTRLPLIGRAVLYQLTPADVEKVRKAVVFLARLFLEGGALKVISLIHGFSEISSEADVQRLETAPLKPRDIECMAFHPLGTCRMSDDPSRGVVDSSFRVHGYEGIYVCDGSVIPSALGVNPQVTIMAFATLLAQQLLADGGSIPWRAPASGTAAANPA